jgi:hypothetical protein
LSVTRRFVATRFLDEYGAHVRRTIRVPFCWPNEQSAPLELMIPKVLSVGELISLPSDGSPVLERSSGAYAMVSSGSYL